MLSDPKNLIPGQHVVPLIADRKADSTVRKALARLGNVLTTEQLTELNRLVDKDKKDPEDVANDWARQHGITKKGSWNHGRPRRSTASIDVVPDDERHGTAVQPVHPLARREPPDHRRRHGRARRRLRRRTPSGRSIGLLLGNLLGGAVMALHSAQGPRLGLPQMIQLPGAVRGARRGRPARSW